MEFPKEFQSSDPEADLNTEFSDFFPDEDEKREKIKNMLKDLIKESKKIIKETEKKFTEEQELLQNLPKLPTGIKVQINRQKSTSKQQKNEIQPTIKKSFPDPFKFKTNLPAGIKIVKLKKSSLDSIVPPATSLEFLSKLPSGIKIGKNFQHKKAPVFLEEKSEIIEESFIDEDFTSGSDFEQESSPINEQNSIKINESTSQVKIKCGDCEKTFSSLQLFENHSDCSRRKTEVKINHQKSLPDPVKFKTPAGIKIVKLKKSHPSPSTSLGYIPKLPSGIKIVKLNKNQKIVEKPTVPLNNFPKLPPGIKVTQLKKAPVILEEESEKMEESFIEDDFIFDSDFERESSPIIESTPLVEIKCGVCEKSFSSLQLLENHSDCNKMKIVERLTASLQFQKLTKINKNKFKRRVEPVKQNENNLKKNIAIKNSELTLNSGSKNQIFEYLKANNLKKIEPKKNAISLQPKVLQKKKPVPIKSSKLLAKSWSADCLAQFDSCNHLYQHEIITLNPYKDYPKRSFVKCKICQTFHNNLDEMKEHIRQGHSEKQIHQSQKRDARYNKLKKSFNQGKNGGKFICPLCDDIELNTLRMYNSHIMEVHKTVEKFPCKICEKILLTETAFNSHMTLAHFDKISKIHQCKYCDVVPFRSEDQLNNHIAKRHAEVEHKPIRNTCEVCGKCFSKYDGKQRHIKEVHSNETNFFCDICGIGFKSATSKDKHYQTHTDERPYPCDQCDGRFRHKHDLTIHKRLHTGERPYECTICHERFVANSNLTKHLRSRHLVKTGISVE